ncbi:AIR synthase related protein [Pseudomonas alliivorans]|nr:AIR synthase related protein [Pseudomonas alliivorans]
MMMSDIGEKGFLRHLLPSLKVDSAFINGFGHDASVLDIGLPDIAIAFKIDRAAKPIAAYNGWAGFESWGRLAVTANISDILAVGATPKGFMLSISVPGNWQTHQTEAVIRGADEECKRIGVVFLGGDTKEAEEAHVVGAAIGVVNKAKIVNRRSAVSGDAILLAGDLGGFAGAYTLLKNIKSENVLHNEYLSHPRCALRESVYLRENFNISSAVDLSDGLWEGLSLLTGENLGVQLEIDALPFHDFAREAAEVFGATISNFAFTVGDWGILYTLPVDEAHKAISLAPEGVKLSLVGLVTDTKGIVIHSDISSSEYKLQQNLRNEHFVQRMENERGYFDQLLLVDFLRITE